MKKIRQIISFLFIFSILFGSLHEVLHQNIHDHDDYLEQSCPVYVLSHAVAVSNEPFDLVFIPKIFERFDSKSIEIAYGFIYFPSPRAPPVS